MRHQYLTKKQHLEAAKEKVTTAESGRGSEPPRTNNGFDEAGSAALDTPLQVMIDPDSFDVFRKYSSIPSHNPNDINPFEDIPSTSPSINPHQIPLTERVGSNLHVSPVQHKPNPLEESKNPTEDLLFGR
jgi:hypothetical protein